MCFGVAQFNQFDQFPFHPPPAVKLFYSSLYLHQILPRTKSLNAVVHFAFSNAECFPFPLGDS